MSAELRINQPYRGENAFMRLNYFVGERMGEGINFLKKSGRGNVTFREFPYYKGEE